jgi:hypothetical protein
MPLHLRTLFAAMTLLVACSSSTAPDLVADPTLGFDTARARWTATRPADYTFEFDAQGAWFPSPGYYHATVVGGRLVDLRLAATGAPADLVNGFTIDQLWDRLAAAKSTGEPLTDLQFSVQGIPIQAMVGTFANDGGVRYRLRAFERTN